MVQQLNDRSIIDGRERLRRRADARRVEILRAAAKVFRRQGYAATGMREIAAAAELSPANLYHYFKGKHEILYFCQDRALDQMLAAVESARLAGGNHATQIREVILAHVLCLLDDCEGSVAHLEVAELPDELRAGIVDKRDRYESHFRRFVADGIESGEFSDCDAQLVTMGMLGAMNWTAHWFRPEGTKTARTVAESLADYLVRGLSASQSNTMDGRRADSGGVR